MKERSNGVLKIPKYHIDTLGLNPRQAVILAVIERSINKNGFSSITYNGLRQYSNTTSQAVMKRDMLLLENKNLLYRRTFHCQTGMKNHFVTQKSAHKYKNYLEGLDKREALKMFEEEFLKVVTN